MNRTSKERAEPGRATSISQQDAASVVDFGQRGDESSSLHAPARELDLAEVLTAVRETAYSWDFASDSIEWAENAAEVLGVADAVKLAKGRAFALLVDPEHAGARYDGITGGPHVAPATEIKYCLHYRFLPEGRRGRAALWVEDTGVCCIDKDARPRLARGTLRVIDERREKEERLLFLGSHDELTGQLNRTRLTEELAQLLSSAGRSPAKGAFLLAGVNDLTLINETYGFDVGDEVIAIVGRRLGRALRGKDCIGRFSSNKFGVVLYDCDAAGLKAIAARLMAAVRDSVIDTSVGAVAASISVGAVLLPEHAGNAQSAIGRCLQALDVARNMCGDRFVLYQPCERRESERRRAVAIADEIVRALNDRRMMLALQPIVTSRSREPELYECLLRMKRLDGSIVSASEFIHVAEQVGLSKLIDHRVLELAIDLLRSIPEIKLALNVSAATATDRQWLSGLEAFTGKDRALTERLTIEITETAAIADLAETVKFVKALKELGCRVALDDFGAGYTSFRSLRLLGVDMVKIDGSFIENLATHAEDEMFVCTLIELARNFGIVTVGEWVGDERTAKLLERAGVAYMQGYFFGVPEFPKIEAAADEASSL
ncbi:bifunctional diguanylate cyclase/phosphodiesterase [Methyloceanibacter sp.]|uniref:bifunctional diguanylate cyclase/phosphodiesterase n=1 Tax=Methyloceanibacter sp. TaxID=1965321 RepID=UPI002D6ACAE0|nr:bifunctional diguanylate cyclase/phosphodiesterase [Methyloceanibacter sp.]HZP09146.1 bifunctional diguanylate cyclase/phosphodiesterase [Methyloceanibacter sp.]